MNGNRRNYSLKTMLLIVTCICIAVALWLTPVRFTFELNSANRTSCQIGDLMDIQDSDLKTIVSKAEVVDVKRIRDSADSIDVVTVRTSLFNRLRLVTYNDFRAVCHPK